MLKLDQRKSSGIWRIRGTHHGVHIDRSARTRSRPEAERIRQSLEKEIFAQVYGFKTPQDDFKFSDAAKSWLQSRGKVSLYFYFDRIIQEMGDILLADLTQGYLDRTAKTLFPTQKPSTINRGFYALVSTILTHAAEERMMNPVKIRFLKTEKHRLDWHSPETVERLIEGADSLAPLLTFFIGTGARTSEVMRLEWDDVSADGSRVTFWKTKSGRPRSVDLCHRTRAMMPRRGTGKVFRRDDGQPWSETHDGRFHGPKRRIDRITQRVDLPKIKLHSLRHSWASWQYALDPDPLRLPIKGGWASLKMVENYAHIATPDLAERVLQHGWAQYEMGNIRARQTG